MDAHRQQLAHYDSEIFAAIAGEEDRERRGIELIPSENYTYPEVFAALGCVLTNKYAEGYPGRRYYGGQEFTDRVENLARERAKAVFRCEHANVQPLSGSPMNQAVYLGFMKPGDPILGMDLSHGGHLTHGAPVSHMGKVFNFVRYKTQPENQGAIDFDEVRRLALESQPKIVLCGYTSYPRDYDYAEFKRIADEVGALTMAGGRRGHGEPLRRGLRHRHHDHAQDAARAPRRHGAVQEGVGGHDRPLGRPRPPRRPPHEHDRRRGDCAEEGARAGVPGVRAAGPAQRPRPGGGVDRGRRHAGHRRH
jgi:hypothetical protein